MEDARASSTTVYPQLDTKAVRNAGPVDAFCKEFAGAARRRLLKNGFRNSGSFHRRIPSCESGRRVRLGVQPVGRTTL